MHLGDAGDTHQLGNMLCPHASAGQNFDAPGRLTNQLPDQRGPLPGRSTLARRQDAGDPQRNQRFERSSRVRDDVEGAVEDRLRVASQLEQMGCAFYIDRAFRGQTAEDKAIDPSCPAELEVECHLGELRRVVRKAPLARAQHHQDRQVGGRACPLHQSGRRGEPAQSQRRTEFNAIPPCPFDDSAFVGGGGDDFQQKFHREELLSGWMRCARLPGARA